MHWLSHELADQIWKTHVQERTDKTGEGIFDVLEEDVKLVEDLIKETKESFSEELKKTDEYLL